MKIVGSTSKGKHAINGSRKPEPPRIEAGRNAGYKPKKRKAVAITLIILAVIIVLIAGVFAVWRWEVQPFYDLIFPRPGVGIVAGVRTPRPTLDPDDVEGTPYIPDSTGQDSHVPIEEVRSMGQITFLIFGIDGYKNIRSEGGSNTDVIMIASFDMDEEKLEVVSIPRDTVVNVPWSTKKANSIYANMLTKYNPGSDRVNLAMEDTKGHFSDLLGFNIDFWVTIDMEAFVSLIDSIGGVEYNVPREMDLSDPDIDMEILLSPGKQRLNGTQSLGLMRYRGYGDGDFGRIETQQVFLKSAAEQILANKNSIDPLEYAKLLFQYIKTDIELANLARIGREMLKLDGEDINFSMMPVSMFSRNRLSYVTVNIDEWLDIVNTKLNPFFDEITYQSVSILTVDANGRLFVTDDDWQGSRNW